jgi:regulatory protein
MKDRPEPETPAVRRAQPDTPSELRARALRLLARREHSRQELARKLAPRAESAEGLQALLSELEGKKQLSDERFAAERARVLSRKFGAARIRQDLKSKGIAEEISGRLVSNSEELEKARAILERKYREPAATREERAKRMRFLQSRGFSSEIIFSLLSARGAD